MYSNVCVLLVAAVFLHTNDADHSHEFLEYYRPGGINGWIKQHKVVANWEEAFKKCQSEGATLVAPTTHVMVGVLMDLMRDRSKKYKGQYLIDVTSRFVRGEFMSYTGVPLRKMPIGNYINRLNWEDGDCLSIDHQEVRVVSCSQRLPFFCYKEYKDYEVMTECGTFDKKYKYSETTGSCYKHHNTTINWPQALSKCSDEGGYLTVVNDNTEAEHVHDISYGGIWNNYIGLRILKDGGGWWSIHGDRLDTLYDIWYNDTYREVTSSDTCAAMCRFTGKLFSFDCKEIRNFVCEKDPEDIVFTKKIKKKKDV